MKKHLLALTAISSALLVSTAVNAAPPTKTLEVKGKLTVPSCEVTADGQQTYIYDFENISNTMVKPTAETTLPSKTKTWVVTCDAETYLNVTPTDTKADTSSSTDKNKFGLGLVNGDGKLGYYTVVLKNAKVDDKEMRLFSSASASFTPATTAFLNSTLKTGWATTAANTQASGRKFQADFEVTPVLASTTTMKGPIAENTNLDGSLQLNFAFGI